MSSKLGRVVAAAGLATLLAPSAAYASWWNGGYQPARREQPPPNQPPRRQPPQPSPGQPPEQQPPEQQPPPEQPPEQPPAEQPPSSEQPPPQQPPPSEQPPPEQQPPAPAQPAPPPAPGTPAGPPPGSLPSIYGCGNTDLPGTAPVLQKSTTPPPGTPVAPGQEISVDITWRVTDWVAPDLHKALDCVYVNNRYAPGLSGGERPTPNDGSFVYSYVVPADVAPGSTICDQGFVSGPNGAEDYAREISNVVCFPVVGPPAPPPPVESTTTTTATTTPPTTAAPTTTTTERPETEAERISQEAPPETPETPAPHAPALPAGHVLPRTGGDPAPGRLAAGALGVAALLGRGRRRKGSRRPRRP
jgi:outer membrane biosynthesis protein TonB